MAQEYFPFDAGAGADVTEDQWRQMARFWLGTGVLAGEDGELAVSERAAGAAMSVDVATGSAWLRGHFFASDAVEEVPIAEADPTDDRIDRLVLAADFVANTVALEVLEGTPDPAPTVPALTQTSGKWEIGLGQVLVQAAAASILDADITDERQYGNTDEIAFVQRTSDLALTAGTELTAHDLITSGELYYDGGEIEVEFEAPRVLTGSGGQVFLVLWDGDAVNMGWLAVVSGGAEIAGAPVSRTRRFTPSEGLHEFQIKAWRTNVNATVSAGGGGIGAFLPATLRIRRRS